MTPTLLQDVHGLLEEKVQDLDERFLRHDPALDALLQRAEACCRGAYQEGRLEDEFMVNMVLHTVYKLHTRVPHPAAPTAEGSCAVERLRNRLEDAFLRHEESLVPLDVLSDLPTDATAYRQWLFDHIAAHPVANHPLFAQFLPHDATAADLRYFLIQESTIDANTDDFLALCQVGTRSTAKIEMASNYWDEMGNGDSELLHAELFERVVESLGVTASEIEQSLETEALICGNLQVMLSLRRRHFYKAIGYFAVVEYMTPPRFAKLLEAWTRNSLDEQASAYHKVHVSVDVGHADRWYQRVIASVLAEHPEAAHDITRGAVYRLNTSQRYLDRVYAQLPSRQVSESRIPQA